MSEDHKPTPLPVQVLPVGSAELYTARPGAVAFLGVAGMLVAIFGAMFSAYFLLMLNIVGARTVAPVAAAPRAGIVWSVSGGNQLPADDSMSPHQRQIVLLAMNAKHALTPSRKALAGALLGQYGNEIVVVPKGGFSEAYVQPLISEAGTTEDGLADYFIFNTGRLEVSDSSASFRLAGSNETRRVDQQAIDLPGEALSAAEIDQVMASLKGSPLSPAQRAALPMYLADPSQQLIARGQVSKTGLAGFVHMQSDDVTFITASTGGWIQMDPSGNVVGTASKPNMAWARGGGGIKIPRNATLLLTIENLLSVLISIALFLICLGALKYAPGTRRRYRLYALLKIATLVVGAFGLHQVMRGMGWNSTGTLTAIYLAAGLAFPMLVLILMQTTSVRNYFVSQGS